MSKVFISYCAHSRDAVKTLAQDIRALDHQVWFDQELVGGHAWWDRILQEIRNCDLFVSALAPEALDSIPCRLEYTYASALGKSILPVMIADGVSSDLLPPALSTVQYVDYRGTDKRAAFALVKALSALPAARPLPDPLPLPPALPSSFLGSIKQQMDEAETLSFDEQTALVVKLKDRLRDSAQAAEARKLLLTLRQRDDLYSKVADEIEAVLGRTRPPPQAQPQAPRGAEASPEIERIIVPLESPAPWKRGLVRGLAVAAVGFVAAFAFAASQGQRYLNSADLWEVDFWFIWPAATAAIALGHSLLARMFRALLPPWR